MSSRTIYLPAGTYLISNSLEPKDKLNPTQNECSVRILGQGIDRTIIKLKDNTFTNASATATTAKYVIATGNKNGGIPNVGFGNYIQNLTVDIGSGNPGAGAVRFDVANCGAIAHLKIVSSSGTGVYGLGFFKQVGPGYIKDITVEGFKYGVYMDDTGVNNVTLEHVNVKNQAVAGIYNDGKNIQVRDLVSNNTVPAIIAVKEYSATILLGATLSGGSSNTPAIQLLGSTTPVSSAFLFARDINVSGYSTSIDVPAGFAKADNTETHVNEWATHDNPLGNMKSLNLPIEEAPEYNTGDLSKWASVVAYGATPGDDSDDDAVGIQAAIDNSGAEIVYFPYGSYTVRSNVYIRSNVKKVDFLFSFIKATTNNVIQVENTPDSQQLIMENMVLNKVSIIQNSSRTSVIRNCGGGVKILTGPGGKGKLFVETAGSHGYVEVRNGISAWLRAVNREEVGFLNEGSTVWVFGDNVERMSNNVKKSEFTKQNINPFKTTNGGRSEYFGGAVDALFIAHTIADGPLFVTDRSTLSAVYAGEFRDMGRWPLHFQNVSSTGIKSIGDSTTLTFQYSSINKNRRFFMPLYSIISNTSAFGNPNSNPVKNFRKRTQ